MEISERACEIMLRQPCLGCGQRQNFVNTVMNLE